LEAKSIGRCLGGKKRTKNRDNTSPTTHLLMSPPFQNHLFTCNNNFSNPNKKIVGDTLEKNKRTKIKELQNKRE